MNYNEKIDEMVQNFQHPCDAEVPAGSYRRVMWEKYNPNLTAKRPAVNEEWETEVIPISKRVYDKPPFGIKSDGLPYNIVTDPETGEIKDPSIQCTGVWSRKLGYCFGSQAELEQYVKDIGSTLLADNEWFGADLSKASLFKRTEELSMYKLENTGATWSSLGPRVDKRSCMLYNSATQAATSLDFDGYEDTRTAYMKHYEDRPCTFVGMKVYPHADTSIPGLPVAILAIAAALPIVAGPCLPITLGFPYNNVSAAMLEAWNKTRDSFKLVFDGLAGTAQGVGDRIATMYDDLSISMEELGNATLAMAQGALRLAFGEFMKVISAALNIVGGGWEMIKSFLPKVTIAGQTMDILTLCTSENGVQLIKTALKDAGTEVIDEIYSVIGSSYKYAIEYVKAKSRDIIDAITDLYDWMWTQLQMAGVALCKLLGELAQIWSMPPIVPNPVWAAILAVRNILTQIKPLDVILSGNFPGFTASDLYDQCMEYINEQREIVYAQVKMLEEKYLQTYKEYQEKLRIYKEKVKRFNQYKNDMWEHVKEETTKFYEEQIAELKEQVEQIKSLMDDISKQKDQLLEKVDDIFAMGMDYLKKLPLISQVNEFLGMVGVGIDDIINVVKNGRTGNSSLYEDFVDGARALKDSCKTIYNQISTLALSKVTQWVNKLLSIIGLYINFPEFSFCVPTFTYAA